MICVTSSLLPKLNLENTSDHTMRTQPTPVKFAIKHLEPKFMLEDT